MEAPYEEGAAWRLPISADRPEVLTEARLALFLRPPADEHSRWVAVVQATFPDPKPLGIPYSYDKLELKWMNHDGEARALLDWTAECTQPGRSLFPRQSWMQEWEIPGTEGLTSLEALSLSLWGSRS